MSFLEYSREFNLIDHICILGIGPELAWDGGSCGKVSLKSDKGYRIFAKLSSFEVLDGENWAGILIPFRTPSSIFIQSGITFRFKKNREVEYVLKLQAPVVRRLDNRFHRRNLYPVDRYGRRSPPKIQGCPIDQQIQSWSKDRLQDSIANKGMAWPNYRRFSFPSWNRTP